MGGANFIFLYNNRTFLVRVDLDISSHTLHTTVLLAMNVYV